MRTHAISLLTTLAILLGALPVRAQSPYTGFTGRDIKALSPEEVEGYLDGRGMGYALAAELNGYPGPKHVLELADELALDDAQRAAVQDSFDRMQARARELGRQIVDMERRIDRAFASGEVTAETLREDLAALGELQADLRFAHLDAHLETKAILTAEQVARYVALRGYADGEHGGHGDHGEHAGHDHRHHR